jgi:hypothetical protein
MHAYEDPNHTGNSIRHHTGKLCYNKCGRPAGTAWSPLLCFQCNVVRMNRINDSMKRIEENLEQMAKGSQ